MSYLFQYYAKVYDRFMNKFHLDDDSMILKLIGAGSLQIADVGGGTGKTADQLIKLGHDVTIIDPSIPMTKRAKRRNHRIQVTNQSMPYDIKEYYDVFLFRDCLHHIEQQKETLKLCLNRLNRDGMIIIADFSPRSFRTKLIFLFERICLEKIWGVEERKLVNLLQEFGLQTEHISINDRDYIVIGRKIK